MKTKNALFVAALAIAAGVVAQASAAVVFDSSYVIGNLDRDDTVIDLSPRMITNLSLVSSASSLALNSITTQESYSNASTSSLTLSPTIVIKFYTPAPLNARSTAADITTSMTLLGTIKFALPTVTLGANSAQLLTTTIPGGGLVIPKNVAVSTYYYDTSNTSVITPASQSHVTQDGWGYAIGGIFNQGSSDANYWDIDDNGLLAGGEEETISGFFAFVPSFVIDASPAPVPEPTSLAVASLGAPALLARRRRR